MDLPSVQYWSMLSNHTWRIFANIRSVKIFPVVYQKCLKFIRSWWWWRWCSNLCPAIKCVLFEQGLYNVVPTPIIDFAQKKLSHSKTNLLKRIFFCWGKIVIFWFTEMKYYDSTSKAFSLWSMERAKKKHQINMEDLLKFVYAIGAQCRKRACEKVTFSNETLIRSTK